MSDYKRKLSNAYDEPPPYEETSGRSTPTLSEDLVAAEALTQLNNGTPPPTTPLSNLTIEDMQHPLVTKVNQVSKHPIITNAFKYYEDSKRNYPHFNYAAGIVERATLPVVAKIEDNLNTRHIQRKSKKRRVNGDKMETKKRLQFCLHILRLANDRINSQVTCLQQRISERESSINEEKVDDKSEHAYMLQTPTPTELSITNIEDITPDTAAEAQQTKTEIITTVKKIIHVISNFKASSLTNDSISNEANELKSTIRDIILKLPSQIQQTANTNNLTSQQTNDRVFLFAKESLDMISRLTNVFNDQLQKAEDWINEGSEVGTPESQTPEAHDLIDNKVQYEQ